MTTIPAETEKKPSHITNIQGEIHVTTDNLNHKERHHRTRFNVLLVAFVLLLVVLSYFAGYYHWLCPNCPQSHVVLPTQPANNAQHNPIVSDTVTTLPGKNSDSTAKTPPPTDTSSSTADTQTNDATATFSPEKTKKEEKTAPQATTTQTIIVKSQHLSSPTKGTIASKITTMATTSTWKVYHCGYICIARGTNGRKHSSFSETILRKLQLRQLYRIIQPH